MRRSFVFRFVFSILSVSLCVSCSNPNEAEPAYTAPDAIQDFYVYKPKDSVDAPSDASATLADGVGADGIADGFLDGMTLGDLPDDDTMTAADTGPEDGAPALCAPGGIKGIVCAPNAQVFVSFAVITAEVHNDCTGGKPWSKQVIADYGGAYQIDDVPPGIVTLTFEKGAFKGSAPVPVMDGKVTDLTGAATKLCFKATGVNIAVILGDSDHIETLIDELGFKYDAFDPGTSGTVKSSAAYKLLTDPAKLAKYEVLFINCGGSLQAMIEANASITTNIKAYVEAGHSLYASDWAWPFVEWPFPKAIEFYGVDNDFTKPEPQKPGPNQKVGPRQGPGPTLTEKKAGTPAQKIQGSFVDTGLVQALGMQSTTIYFDLGTWVVIQAAGTGTTTHLLGDIQAKTGNWGSLPLAVSFKPGNQAGKVVYTSFHNIAQKDAGGSVDDIKAILSYLVFSL